MQPGPSDWSKYQEHLKRIYMTESSQTEMLNKPEEPISNPHTMAQVPPIQYPKTLPKTHPIKQKSQRSAICPSIPKISGKSPQKHNNKKKQT